MKKIITLTALSVFLGMGATAQPNPEADRQGMVKYFENRFPGVDPADYINGTYAFDENARSQWEAIEDFPPYELAIEEGQELFETEFANGKSLASCFDNGGIGIRQNYPFFDQDRSEVITLEMAIEECRKNNGEEPYGYKSQKLAAVSAYMAYTSRGNLFDVKVDSDEALAAYNQGKSVYFTRTGALNLSCASCHMQGAGMKVRADVLSMTVGHVSHFPTHRSKTGNMNTLHRRFEGCMRDSFTEYYKAQSEEFRNLEFFLTYMSNGLAVNGPGSRK